MPQQVVLLLPILEGLDGTQKMSKSRGNYIGVNEPASEIFGKLMSISDELMARYYPLLLGKALDSGAHPLDAKKHLASEIVQTYHSRETAQKALEDWNSRFSEKRLGEVELPSFVWPPEESHGKDATSIVSGAYVFCFKMHKSRTEVRRLIEQGSVQVDGEKLREPKAVLSLKPGQILRLDKTRAVRIVAGP